MSTDQAIEQEILAKGLTAPRITPGDIDAEIVEEHYFTAADGLDGAAMRVRHERAGNCGVFEFVTICALLLRNGTKVFGVNEGPVSAANFDASMGRQLARQKAVDQVWPMLGYELRTKLHQADITYAAEVACEG